MFTVGSCTVLYNPNESVLTNLNSYSNCVDVSVVVDNSDTKNEISQSLKNDPNFIYIDMDGNKYKTDYSVIGLNFNQKNCQSDEIVEIPCWLTSGNFVNIDTFNRIGKFDERLFIDYVDIELGYKLYKSNLKICYLKNYSLKHEIGNPIEIHLFGKTYHAMNHSPIRYYYRYRNAYYLYHFVDKDFFRKERT